MCVCAHACVCAQSTQCREGCFATLRRFPRIHIRLGRDPKSITTWLYGHAVQLQKFKIFTTPLNKQRAHQSGVAGLPLQASRQFPVSRLRKSSFGASAHPQTFTMDVDCCGAPLLNLPANERSMPGLEFVCFHNECRSRQNRETLRASTDYDPGRSMAFMGEWPFLIGEHVPKKPAGTNSMRAATGAQQSAQKALYKDKPNLGCFLLPC